MKFKRKDCKPERSGYRSNLIVSASRVKVYSRDVVLQSYPNGSDTFVPYIRCRAIAHHFRKQPSDNATALCNRLVLNDDQAHMKPLFQ
eukprot:scaffold9506_cov103-Skeletonema_menzelii.AAC.1